VVTTGKPENWASNTIVGIPLESPHQLTSLLDQPEKMEESDLAVEKKLFKIRLADSDGRRNSASMLIRKMYAWRGYQTKDKDAPNRQPNRLTLVAAADDITVATITVGFDSPIGLLVDQLYQQEVDSLRQAGHRICEFTKLAVDNAIRSKRVLGSLFHIACIYGRKIYNNTDLLIEVNPRHVKFYEKMLGFTQYGPERLNPRVNATAVLMRLKFDYLEQQIAIFGGKAGLGKTEKSLYPYFFSPTEEGGITRRLIQST
jgi:hypothetical protein